MDELLQRVAYLQGLADGLGIDDNSKEGQVLLELIDTLFDVVETVKYEYEDLREYVDILEEDLTNTEEYLYGDADDYDDFDDFEDLDDYDDFDEYSDDEDYEFSKDEKLLERGEMLDE